MSETKTPEERTESESDYAAWDGQIDFLKFAEAIVPRVLEWALQEGIPQRSRIETTFIGDSSWDQKEVRELSYSCVLWRHRDLIYNLPEATECASKHLAHGVLKQPTMSDAAGNPILSPTFEQMRFWLVEPVVLALAQVMDDNATLAPTQEQLVSEYWSRRRAWESTHVTWIVTVPLVNIEVPAPRLKLSDLELISLTPEDKTRMIGVGIIDIMTPFEMIKLKLAFRGEHTSSLSDGADDKARTDSIARIVTSMRLAKAGRVGVAFVHKRDSASQATKRVGYPRDVRATLGSGYKLMSEDADTIKRLFVLLGHHRSDLTVGLRRFNQSYDRESLEDRLIDLTIVLESTILADVEVELKYRLAVRGAALLVSIFEPHWTKNVLQAAYDVRSDVVHEGQELGDRKSKARIEKALPGKGAHEFVDRFEDLVRETLVAYLSAPGPVVEVNKSLDELIVSGLRSCGH